MQIPRCRHPGASNPIWKRPGSTGWGDDERTHILTYYSEDFAAKPSADV